MTRFRYLSFLTDYGLDDGFVAACHGVGARIAPHAGIIDVTHLVPPGDIRRGAAVLAQTVPYLPPAVHVAVVDPGVGTARRAVTVAAGQSVFVGPDNGLLSWAVAAAGGAARAHVLTNAALWLTTVSATFHGRDIFMPVAAHLAAGADLAAVGEEIGVGELVTLPAPQRLVRGAIAEGEVLTVDRFGNVQLALTASDAAQIGVEPGGIVLVNAGARTLALPYRDTFGAVAPGELVAYADSAGLVSIAVNGGNAAQRLGLPPGARVSLAAPPGALSRPAASADLRGLRQSHRRTETSAAFGRDAFRGRQGAWHDYIAGSDRRCGRPARSDWRRCRTEVPYRSFRGTGVPSAGLAAATALLGALAAFGPAAAGSTLGTAAAAQQDAVRSQEWWLAGLHVPQAAASGAAVTVAVLGTGVAAGHPDLAGAVITGPDYTGSGRAPGSPYWGIEGTAVAGIIAGHGHGARGAAGIVGIAPAAKILAVRVTLEYNDPLASDPDLARRLPDAIAAGIRYAVDHGARIIDLPLDPGTLGLTGQPDLAAVGGSPAEQAAVGYALRNNVLLVAPAGDDGLGAGIVNYPAAYRGVIAVGAVARDGSLASFTSRRSYVALTAPGVALVAAAAPAGYVQLSTTGLSSGIVAGVAALVLSRFPHLTVAEMTRALTASTAAAVPGAGATTAPLAARPAAGSGYGTVDAARAVQAAAMIVAAAAPRRPAARPRKLARPSVA
ncbi:MAG: SAM-dependent chlorinase/fluorinase, partial [Streptosporangiaceae bacterium]|nr:SAM-dependent chlorinase/fluorinase [Streptosporangiaceae bacterium]